MKRPACRRRPACLNPFNLVERDADEAAGAGALQLLSFPAAGSRLEDTPSLQVDDVGESRRQWKDAEDEEANHPAA